MRLIRAEARLYDLGRPSHPYCGQVWLRVKIGTGVFYFMHRVDRIQSKIRGWASTDIRAASSLEVDVTVSIPNGRLTNQDLLPLR
jgi:hypothetical protein